MRLAMLSRSLHLGGKSPVRIPGSWNAIQSKRKFKSWKTPKESATHWNLLDDVDLKEKEPRELLNDLNALVTRHFSEINTKKLGWKNFEAYIDHRDRQTKQRLQIYSRIIRETDNVLLDSPGIDQILLSQRLAEMSSTSLIIAVESCLNFSSYLILALSNSPYHLDLQQFKRHFQADKFSLTRCLKQLQDLSILEVLHERSNPWFRPALIRYKAKELFHRSLSSTAETIILLADMLKITKDFKFSKLLRFNCRQNSKLLGTLRNAEAEYMAFFMRRASSSTTTSIYMTFAQQLRDVQQMGYDANRDLMKWLNINQNRIWAWNEYVGRLRRCTETYRDGMKSLWRAGNHDMMPRLAHYLSTQSTSELERKERFAYRYWSRRLQISREYEEAMGPINSNMMALVKNKAKLHRQKWERQAGERNDYGHSVSVDRRKPGPFLRSYAFDWKTRSSEPRREFSTSSVLVVERSDQSAQNLNKHEI